MSKSSLSLLFPGCEAFDDDINVDINTTGTPADTADAATEAEDLATEGAETQSEAEETSTAAEAFAHQFSELCALQKHIARFGVDRTFLALCNRNNILGRALNLRLPAMESFDSVGSPRSATSIACLEALSEGLWQKFKDFISRVCKAVRNFILKMTQWWNEVSGNYETRLKKYDDFFDSSRQFKEQSDLEGFKGDWTTNDDLIEFERTMSDIKAIGDKGEALTLIDKAEKVINAVLRVGSSARATYGTTDDTTKHNDSIYNETTDTISKQTSTAQGKNNLKDLADELSEKAQENRDKILDKLSDWKDKVDDKLDSITDKMKDQDYTTILQDIGGGAKAGGAAKASADTFITSAKKYINAIRRDQDRDKQFNQALSMALERLDRRAMAKEGSPMDLDTRDAITRSVTTAQQILTKVNLTKTVHLKLLNLYFKNLATLKSMCKIQ